MNALEVFYPTINMDIPRERRRAPRTRTGCLPCRLRRKKCEEQKPICIGCERNHLLCSWPSIDPSSDRIATLNSTEQPERQNSRHWMKELSSGRPVSSNVRPKSQRCEDSSDEQNLSDTFEKPGKNESCPQSHSPGPFAKRLNSPSQLLPLFRSRITSDASKTLLDHYIHSTALRISGRLVPYNPYVTEILPVALDNDGVLHIILALSGAHLNYRTSDFGYHSRSHYAVAVRSVKHQLGKWEELDIKESMGLLTAILFLCLFEVSYSWFEFLSLSRISRLQIGSLC